MPAIYVMISFMIVAEDDAVAHGVDGAVQPKVLCSVCSALFHPTGTSKTLASCCFLKGFFYLSVNVPLYQLYIHTYGNLFLVNSVNKIGLYSLMTSWQGVYSTGTWNRHDI